jgi:hypothetical protein
MGSGFGNREITGFPALGGLQQPRCQGSSVENFTGIMRVFHRKNSAAETREAFCQGRLLRFDQTGFFSAAESNDRVME